MTTDQTDRAECLRVRAHNLKAEIEDLADELDGPGERTSQVILIAAGNAIKEACNHLLNVVDRKKLPRSRPATVNPFDSLHAAICTTSRDMGEAKLDAWVYGVVVGWDSAMPELAAKFGWTEETQARLRQLHEVFNTQKELHKS